MSYEAITAFATLGGFILIIIQLYLNSRIEKSKFEYDISKRYIDIANNIKFETMYIESNDPKFDILIKDHLNFFYQYYDLTNQEIFLRRNKRIRKKTWEEWEDGVKDLIVLDSFKHAWKLINDKVSVDTFTEYRDFISNGNKIKY